jgi:hypothetical protein
VFLFVFYADAVKPVLFVDLVELGDFDFVGELNPVLIVGL